MIQKKIQLSSRYSSRVTVWEESGRERDVEGGGKET